MGNLGEDLASKLRRVLYQHQVELESAITRSDQSSSTDSTTDSNDPTLTFISKMLLDDDEEEEVEQQKSEQQQQSYQDLLDEFTTIVAPSAPQVNYHRYEADYDQETQLSSIDIHWTLMQCARAVAANNASGFYDMASDLKLRISPPRSASERAAGMFLDALLARLTKTGGQAYRAMVAGISSKRLLTMRRLNLPVFHVSHLFANEMILRACAGASRVHIVDYGIGCGFQWPYVISALSQRPEGPPLLKITGVDLPIFREAPGQRLLDFANSIGVHLDYTDVSSSSWETVQPVVHSNELLIVNSNLRLGNMKDDFVAINHPRKMLFERIYKMKPKLFVQCVCSAAFSSPFFLPRFEEALKVYVAKMEYFEAWLKDDLEERGFAEMLLAKGIMNLVGCEGTDLIERSETHRSWDSRAKRAGFDQLPLDKELYERVKMVWGGYKNSSENFCCGRDENWMMLGWKNVIMMGLSAWEPQKKL